MGAALPSNTPVREFEYECTIVGAGVFTPEKKITRELFKPVSETSEPGKALRKLLKLEKSALGGKALGVGAGAAALGAIGYSPIHLLQRYLLGH